MGQNFIKGILFGATAGSLGGLLFAPRSGKETQQKIKVTLDQTGTEFDDAAAAAKELRKSVQNFSQEMKKTQQVIQETIPFIKTSLKKEMDAFKFQAEPRLERINQQTANLQEHIADFSDSQ